MIENRLDLKSGQVILGAKDDQHVSHFHINIQILLSILRKIGGETSDSSFWIPPYSRYHIQTYPRIFFNSWELPSQSLWKSMSNFFKDFRILILQMRYVLGVLDVLGAGASCSGVASILVVLSQSPSDWLIKIQLASLQLCPYLQSPSPYTG